MSGKRGVQIDSETVKMIEAATGSLREVAAHFGVSKSTVNNIRMAAGVHPRLDAKARGDVARSVPLRIKTPVPGVEVVMSRHVTLASLVDHDKRDADRYTDHVITVRVFKPAP